MISFLKDLQVFIDAGKVPQKIVPILERFNSSYINAGVENGYSTQYMEALVSQLLERMIDQLKHPYTFDLFHKSIRTPFDYYQFGLDFIRPLIDIPHSKVHRLHIADQISTQLEEGDNVILLTNHQTEPDPQVISILLENTHPKLAEEKIFVAGQRVISDPLAIPFSMGCNLLCIFSKNYIENPPELKPQKTMHNQRTMRVMGQLLSEGGKCIIVAPSGGRDRPNDSGQVEVSKFDPNSVEMFWLMAQQAKRMTHFYPLTLATYDLLPPPNIIQKDLGEQRTAKCTPVHLAFGEEIDLDDLGEEMPTDKKHRRKHRAEYVWNVVNNDYHLLTNNKLK